MGLLKMWSSDIKQGQREMTKDMQNYVIDIQGSDLFNNILYWEDQKPQGSKPGNLIIYMYFLIL